MRRLTPPPSWLHPALRVQRSPIQGQGLFVTHPLAAGTEVMRLGGRLVTRAELQALLARASRTPGHPYVDSLSVDDGVDLVLDDPRLHHGNHGCDPNVWHVGPFALATRRALDVGEEVLVDYGTQTDDASFAMACRCGSAHCRGTVTGVDWKRPDLRERYGAHWVPVLQGRIAALRAGGG